MDKEFAPYNLYSIDIDGSDLKQLTDFAVNTDLPIGNPAISPDGKRVIFSAPKDPDSGVPPMSLYMMEIDGSGIREIFGDNFIGGTEPSWSPDQEEIVFIAGDNNFRNLYKVELKTLKITQLTFFDEDNYGHAYDPCYSPDGKQICFALKLRGVTAGQEIFAIDSDGTDMIRLTPAKKINAYPGWVTDKYPDWIE
jgi:Tol biopolymer transport system component